MTAPTAAISVDLGQSYTNGGAISGTGGLTASGRVSWRYPGSNTYSGGTTLSAGTLAILSDNNLGLSSGGISIGPATLVVSGVVASTRNIALTAPNAAISVDLLQSYNNSGTISGSGGLTVSGQGLLLLSGSNNYSGATTISAGTLQVGGPNALPGGALAAKGGVLDLAGQSVTTTSFSGAAGTVTTSVASPVTLTINQTGATAFGGALQNGNGTLSLAFSGGRLLLSGANGYSGGTTLSAGTLAITNAASLGLASGGLSIGPATLEVSGIVASTRNIILTDPNAAITVDLGQSYNNSGTISGSGGLTTSGPGLLTLSGANNFNGTTTLGAGTLQLGNANALQSSALWWTTRRACWPLPAAA